MTDMAAADIPPCTVLICDDQPEMRAALDEVLTLDPRFEVVGQAIDGPSCLEQLSRIAPDVLMLDVRMRGGGPNLARAAKLARPSIYILVFSATSSMETRAAMLAAGGDMYVVKTGRLRPLLDALVRACQQRRENRALV